MRLGTVAALPLEARCLLGHAVKPGECIVLPDTGWVQLSGMGPQNARKAAESLLQAGATALVSWGVAAGLAPALHRGDLVLPKTVLSSDGHALAVDEAWHTRVYHAVSGHINTSTENLAETIATLTTPNEKATLFQHSGAVAADMESAAVGAVARQAGIPFLVVRAIVDGYATSLPPAAIAAMSMSGKFRLWSWIKSVLQRPAQLPAMLPLALDMLAARATLTRVASLAGPALQVEG